ncbi:MAG: MmgE/PrpD family protein, partial [Gammaproteobacteria bacterium]|nr:MmgE/PrpD family protein [Gammaproteobacteria bacterium]
MTVALTRDLAAFVAGLRFEHVPEAALPFIRMGFTDCFATLVAGRESPEARMLLKALQPAPGECRLLVDRGSARAPEAAWVNATAAHALDYDDAAQRGHISVVVVPAVLADAESLGASGERMATAYAAGYETWAELVRRERDHYHNGSWHPTGVFGPLAVAAASASLHGLSAEQTAHALAIAASQAAGLIANFGTMTKPYHAGRASHAGLMAVRLAEQGFTGAEDALEHAKGLMAGISPSGRVDLDTPVAAGVEWKLPVGGVNIKKSPTCFATHRALDGVLELLREEAVDPGAIRGVTVSISARNRSTLRYAAPRTAAEAKFSMPFAMASALVAGRCSLAELRDDFVGRADVRAMMERVDVAIDAREDKTRPGEAPQDTVRLDIADGRVRTRAVDYVRGGPEVPLAPGELFAKFEGCLDFGGLRVPARRLFDTL